MGGFRVLFVAGVLGLGACASPDVMDLSENPRLYQPTGYVAKVPADRTVFVAPVIDDRGPRPTEATQGYTTQYFPDGRWKRLPVEMVDAVLRDELASSRVFAAVKQMAEPSSCILQMRVTQFDVGAETHVSGNRSLASVTLEVEILGPADGSGARQTLLTESFEQGSKSELDWRPPAASGLMGLSLRGAMQRVLSWLDQSNVGRSNVPLNVQ